jgi:hypothetical protein
VGRTVFEYVGVGNDEPLLVGVSGGPTSRDLIGNCGTRFGSEIAPGPAADLSADGRVVYFTTLTQPSGLPCASGTGVNAGVEVPVNELFARIDGGETGAQTVAVSEPRAPEVTGEPQPDCVSASCEENTSVADQNLTWRKAVFEGASSDGLASVFISAQQLTDSAVEDETAGDNKKACTETVGSGCNLYLFDLGAPVGERLVDVSAAAGGGVVVGGPRVQGVVGFSGDGSHVYFVARGVLTGTAVNAEGVGAVDGGDNLYLYERDAAFPSGRVVFVATLPQSDFEEWAEPGHPANVSSDGRFLVFTSRGLLTGDVTRSDGAVQVFRYDAVSGGLLRVSVGEDGFDDDGNGGAGNASIVPGYKGFERGAPAQGDPSMSDDGSRVFFMSPVALTSKALASVVIGTQVNIEGGEHVETAYAENVYEWEREGVGSCPAGQAAGCVFLISDGRDTSGAPPERCYPNISAVCLAGTDASGGDVFFTTSDSLVQVDTDTEMDVYDARVCEPERGNPCVTGAPSVLPPCLGEACHGVPPAAPSVPEPGSASFKGPDNPPNPKATVVKPPTQAQLLAKALKACRTKHNKRKRVACEAQARHRYAPAKKAAHKTARKSARSRKTVRGAR